MRTWIKAAISGLAFGVAATSCSDVPSGVLKPKDMAELMADIHTGEAVVEMQRMTYNNDSAKTALKQSIYARHGVDAAMVDSSYEWYGRNIGKYMDVYDRTIEILEERLRESGNRVQAESGVSAAGDSVDVWYGPRFMRIGHNSLSDYIPFRLTADNNWEEGDSYTLRFRVYDNSSPVEISMVTEYADGTVEYLHNRAAGDGWKDLTFYTDSTRQAKRLYGFASLHAPADGALKVDSIQIIRRRLNKQTYSSRYRQRILRSYERGVKPYAEK